MKTAIVLLFFLCLVERPVAQTDTIPPTLVCKDLYVSSVDTMAICWALIPAAKLIDTVYDNANSEISLGLRFDCESTGFPINSSENFFIGTSLTEVWAKDSAGNTSVCLSKVKVYDLGFCDPAYYRCKVVTPVWQPLVHTTILVNAGNCLFDSIHFVVHTSATGHYYDYIYGGFKQGFNTTVTPYRNQNPLNGITTYDLLLIQKHILGIQPLDTPYALIAADVNMDGLVNSSDLLLLRKLLLGIIEEFPHRKSWRFVWRDYKFPHPESPFEPIFPERYSLTWPGYPPYDFEFIGIKLGDVNFSADPNY